jgi:hypothetical protein
MIQNKLDAINIPPYDPGNPDNYANPINWGEVNTWYLNNFSGGQAQTIINTLFCGDAGGTGLHVIDGGSVLTY